MIRQKNLDIIDDKLLEYIGKPREVSETLKSLDSPNKTLVSNFNAVESNKALTVDKKTTANIFKDFFSNLAESLLIRLPNALHKYNLESVFYYAKFIIEKPFHLSNTSEEVFKIMQNTDA